MPFGESAEKFFHRIDAAPWFERLGLAVTYDRFVAIVDRAEWRAYARFAAALELGVSVRNSTGIPELAPLADSNQEVGAALARLEAEPLVLEPLKHVRAAVHRRVLNVTHELPRSAWLCFGSTDLRPRAAESAAVAARWAVTEQYLCRAGFWSEVFELFLRGNWPYGCDAKGSLYVL